MSDVGVCEEVRPFCQECKTTKDVWAYTKTNNYYHGYVRLCSLPITMLCEPCAITKNAEVKKYSCVVCGERFVAWVQCKNHIGLNHGKLKIE